MKIKQRQGAVDSQLAELAARLDSLDFTEANEGDLYLIQDHPLKNVALFRDGTTFCVHYRIGGKRKIIGITQSMVSAARYADCAKLFFWPHRMRGAKPPTDADMNFSLASAEAELANNDALGRLLQLILEHVMDTLPPKETRATMAAAFAAHAKEINRKFDDLGDGFAHIRKRLTAIEEHLGIKKDATSPQHLT